MYTQSNFSVTGQGIIVIVPNNPFSSRDNSNAIIRRIIIIETGKTFISSISRDPLFIKVRGLWTESLVPELPGIINWILDLAEGHHEKYIVNFYENVKSLSGLYQQTRKLLSPLDDWLNDEIDYIDSCKDSAIYLGYNVQTFKGSREIKERKALYPAIFAWCKRQGYTPYKHNTFSSEILNICRNKGYVCEKIRKKEGIFITCLLLKPFVYDRDYILGASLNNNLTVEGMNNNLQLQPLNKISLYIPPVQGKTHSSLDTNLYNKYMGYLSEKDTLDKHLNKGSRSLINREKDISQKIYDRYTESIKFPCSKFKEGALKVINTGL